MASQTPEKSFLEGNLGLTLYRQADGCLSIPHPTFFGNSSEEAELRVRSPEQGTPGATSKGSQQGPGAREEYLLVFFSRLQPFSRFCLLRKDTAPVCARTKPAAGAICAHNSCSAGCFFFTNTIKNSVVLTNSDQVASSSLSPCSLGRALCGRWEPSAFFLPSHFLLMKKP